MTFKTNHTEIDPSKCKKCGSCVRICPTTSISMSNETAYISKQECMYCGHCEATCSSNAITIKANHYKKRKYTSFEFTPKYLPPGGTNLNDLVNLMSSRRSCREYYNKPVEKNILDDIIKIGTLAPSGTNSQLWSFITLPNRESVEEAANLTEKYFRKLNKLSKNILLRNGLKLFGNSELKKYYNEYLETVEEALNERKETGKDKLFHGAPAAIIVCADHAASCPAEDTLLATQNMLLAIHAMGLGSCLIGFMVEAIKREKSIVNFLKLTKNQKVYAVIALGYPKVKYNNLTARFPLNIREINCLSH